MNSDIQVVQVYNAQRMRIGQPLYTRTILAAQLTGRLTNSRNLCLQERYALMYQGATAVSSKSGLHHNLKSSRRKVPNPLISLYDARVAYQPHTRSIKSAVVTKPCQLCLPTASSYFSMSGLLSQEHQFAATHAFRLKKFLGLRPWTGNFVDLTSTLQKTFFETMPGGSWGVKGRKRDQTKSSELTRR
jgi:hypothetical protein